MKILFASSEVAPFIKTGGLADVAGSLPVELAKAGHDVKVILPLYERVSSEWREKMQFVCYFDITLAWRRSYCGMFSLEKDGVTQKIFVPMVEPLRMELLDFVDRVMSGTEPAANGPAACRTIWIAETVIAQAGKQPTFR